VARGLAARRRARGGEVVPALGTSLARVTALAAAIALAAYPLAYAGKLAPLAGVFGVVGLALLAPALAGFPGFVPWALVALAADYTLVDLAREVRLAAAPFEGAGLLLVAELAYGARELARGPEERGLLRAAWLLAVAAGALVVALVPVLSTEVSPPEGLAAELLAVVAAASLLALPAFLARRR
jgi:hypothetical protein